MKNTCYDLIIVGGGASGLMAAITAGRLGAKVLLLEQKDRVGKKILATGNGKCNFTNAYMKPECFHGSRRLAEEVLAVFGTEDTLAFFHEIGIWPKSRDGYYYPNSEQALSVLLALERELGRYPVTLQTGISVIGISAEREGFLVSSAEKSWQSRKLLIACGLKANPKLGSDGSLLPVVERLGHHFNPVLPALCPFYASGLPFRDLAGIRIQADLTLLENGHTVCRESGELQLTDYGISGIPVFQISSDAVKIINRGSDCQVSIDFLPDFSENDLFRELCFRRDRDPQASVSSLLTGLIPQKLIPAMLKECGIPSTLTGSRFAGSLQASLVKALKTSRIRLSKARDYEFAQVCCGGIPESEVNWHTLESRLLPGLYFAGEILDVDGICGGYNLQWAWSSGYLAACSACGIGALHMKKRFHYDTDQSDKTSGSSYRRRSGRQNPKNTKTEKQ